MSPLVSPVWANTSRKIGTSISTPFVVPEVWRTFGASANATTATSRIRSRSSKVARVGIVGRVGLAGRLEVVDVLRGSAPLPGRLPHGPDPHAHPDVFRRTAEDQVLERDVGAV